MSLTLTETLLYLLACALSGQTPEAEFLNGIDLHMLLKFAKAHSVSALAAGSVLEAVREGIVPDEAGTVSAAWKTARMSALKRTMLFDAERREILDFLEQSGIEHMPLKGILMQNLYPAYGTREMADNDIWYDIRHYKTVRNYMAGRGYSFMREEQSQCDSYHKKPVYNFEMHTELMERRFKRMWEYYQNIRQRMIPDAGSQYGMHLSDEDFYIYLILHAYKHYLEGGTGLRTLADIYVYLRTYNGKLDMAYIAAELEKLDLDFAGFAHNCVFLAEKLFADPARTVENIRTLPPEQSRFLNYLAASGTYGTTEHLTEIRLNSLRPEQKKITWRTQIRYIFRRLFPPADILPRSLYPWRIFTYLPYLCWRMCYALIAKRGKIAVELRTVFRDQRAK